MILAWPAARILITTDVFDHLPNPVSAFVIAIAMTSSLLSAQAYWTYQFGRISSVWPIAPGGGHR
jgi:hypothetical protein